MEELIRDAINKRIVLRFEYNNKVCIVEPFTYGINKNENTVLSAYLLDDIDFNDNKNNWRIYDTSKIESLRITNKSAKIFRNGYVKNDSRLSKIICEV